MPSKPRRMPPKNPPVLFFMAAVKCFYTRDEVLKEREFNVLFEASAPQITKNDLDQIQQSALKRMQAENGVEPQNFVDIVFLSVFPLGQMTPTEFYGEPTKQPLDA